MRDRPDLTDDELASGLARFGITNATATYAAVGFGDHHWEVRGGGERWFTSVADLEHKDVGKLRQAMRTALGLRLPFVVAPLRADDGDPVVELGRYALSVFPHVEGTAGHFGDELAEVDRDEVLGLLAQLHGCAPPETTPVTTPGLPDRKTLFAGAWHGGPYARAAADLLAEHAELLRAKLAEFDRLAEAIAEERLVVTHGEPHPGNLIRTDTGHRLVDWDTVGLAVPERDLSLLGGDLSGYSELTGHPPNPEALALYRLRWSLDDVCHFAALFRAPHESTPDTDASWGYLTGTLAELSA